jgi:putative PEP-CTERM system histidine kinase
LLGIIGIGAEFTGGRYSYDDYDLLAALGMQAGSALQATRMAEEAAKARQMETWNALSAFVLHDVKNAANMLSLVRGNARQHIGNPDFQKDMLNAVDNALSRMAKVQERLNTFRDEMSPALHEIELAKYFTDYCQKIRQKVPKIRIIPNRLDEKRLITDPEILSRVLDNLMLNSFEAGGEGTEVKIEVSADHPQQAVIEVSDDGPGIPKELLPDALFEPFKTTKLNGTGIGLWQVKWMIKKMGGTIAASNLPEGGARFVITLPLGKS